MPIDLSALEETGSLLIPAYAVARAGDGRGFTFGPAHCVGPMDGPEETYGLLHRDEAYLQPRGTARFLFGASALFNDAIGPAGQRRTIRLREAGEPMAPGLENTCLMAEGPRVGIRRHQDRTELLRGYAAWSETRNVHRWVSAVSRTAANAAGTLGKTMLFGRSGRGALIARLEGGGARLLLLDFHVEDRDPDLPDLLFVWASRTDLHAGEFPRYDPCGARLDDGWHGLIRAAIEGDRNGYGP